MLTQIKKFLILDTHRLRNLILVILFLSIIFSFQLFLRQKISLNLFFLLTVLFSINYLCYIFYFSLEREKKYFPLYPLIIFYYLLTFTAYFYFDQDEYFFVQNEVMIKVIIIISLGLFFFSLGYFIPNLFYKDKKDIILKDVDKYNALIILGSYIFLIFIHINNYITYINLGFLDQLREPLTLLIVAILQLKYFEKKSLTLLFLNIFFITALFFVELSSGSTVFSFLIILMVIAINYFKTKKLNLINISLICYSVFFFHGIKNDIRDLNWVDKSNDKTLNKPYVILNDLVKDQILNDPSENKTLNDSSENKTLNDPSKDKTIVTNLYDTYKVVTESVTDKEKLINSDSYAYQKYRFFHSNITLQKALDLTPHAVKFLNGKSYKSIIYKPIPRFIYKDKPKEEWGNAFGQIYKILLSDDFITSWNFPILSEFYSNFGFIGVIFGMLLLGLFSKILIFFTYSLNQSMLLTSMGYVVIFNLVYQESNLSLPIGKMINQILFFVAIICSVLIFNFFVKYFFRIIQKT